MQGSKSGRFSDDFCVWGSGSEENVTWGFSLKKNWELFIKKKFKSECGGKSLSVNLLTS